MENCSQYLTTFNLSTNLKILLCALRAAHPDCDFAFVVGSDWLQPGTDLRQRTSSDPSDPTGERAIVTGDRLVEEFDFLVVPRPGYDVPAGGLVTFTTSPRPSLPSGSTFRSSWQPTPQ